MRGLVLSVTQEPHVRTFLTSGPGRRLAERFVAGETLDDAIVTTRQLLGIGARVALNFLGEAVESRAEAEEAANVYIQTIPELRRNGLTASLAIKPTQFGLDLDFGQAVALVSTVASEAEVHGLGVRLDMEGSRHTDAILNLWEAVFAHHRNVGVVLQAALFRTSSDLERVLAQGGSVRLCKGAYAESPKIAYQDWRNIRASFDCLMRQLLKTAAARPVGPLPTAAIATHDETLIERAIAYASELGLDGTQFELQMLYGVRRDFQTRLLAERVPLRIYVPWGPAWYKYLTRRLAERPSNLMFLGRAVVGEALAGLGWNDSGEQKPREGAREEESVLSRRGPR